MSSSPANSSRRISLRDVARVVGVSHMAVSLALRGDARVSEARRATIRRVADDLGYRPDPMLSSLAAYRQARRGVAIRSTIAWINRWPEPQELKRHREFTAFWEGAAGAARDLGYQLEEFVVAAEVTGERLHRILSARNVRGILIPPHPHPLQLDDFDWDGFAVVRLGTSVPHPRAHAVSCDQLAAARLAFERIRAHGYRRIGFVTSARFDRNTLGNFRAGFLLGQATHVPPQRRIEPLALDERATPESARRLGAWLRRHRTDAVLCSNPVLRPLLAQLDRDVPHGLAVAVTSVLDGKFDTGIDQNCAEIGAVALRTLAGQIQQNERGLPPVARRVLVEPRWIDGTSLPPRVRRDDRRDG